MVKKEGKVFYGMLPLLHDLCERIINSDSRFKNKTSIHWFMLALLNKVKVKEFKKLFEYMFETYIDNDKTVSHI